MPAPVQITAEQLLREAKERELELVQAVSLLHALSIHKFSKMLMFLLQPPRQKISDPQELAAYQLKMRKVSKLCAGDDRGFNGIQFTDF